MKVAICRSAKAYLPEVDAYARYLAAKGIEARCVEDRREIASDDIAILFRFEDQMARDLLARRRIHEEHNIPTGLRGLLRSRLLAVAPACDGQIRLEQADAALPRPTVPTLVRPCGIDPALFDLALREKPDHDLVYCGSLDRPGVIEELEWLGAHGFSVGVYGRIPPGTPQSRMEAQGVRFYGRIGRHEVPEALANARAGLNMMPDRRPWNVQESMKTLEYMAAGLPVVSSRYAWAERFSEEHDTQFLWLETLERPAQLDDFEPPRADLRDRAWPELLDRVGFVDFLHEIDA